VHEVVIDEDERDDGVEGVGAALVDEVVEDVGRDGVGVDVVGHAVPVVQRVEALGAGLAVEVAHGSRQIQRGIAKLPDVRSKRVAQADQRRLNRGRRGQLANHVLPERARQRALDGRADVGEG
jgi:hypothetical protein